MATEVKCTVSDCQFWARGNYCGASSILVTAGRPHLLESDGGDVDKFGQDAPKIEPTPIRDIEDSYCYTFIQKTQTSMQA